MEMLALISVIIRLDHWTHPNHFLQCREEAEYVNLALWPGRAPFLELVEVKGHCILIKL